MQYINRMLIYIYQLFTISFFFFSCAAGPRLPSIDVEEKEKYTIIQVENNILQGSILDLDKNLYDELGINPWMYKYKDGRTKFYLAVNHRTKDELYTSTKTTLTVICDSESLFWDSPKGELRESYLYKHNNKTGEKEIIHYYGLNLFPLTQDQFIKFCQAKEIRVQSIGKRQNTNWRFGLQNFQIIHQFYSEYYLSREQQP